MLDYLVMFQAMKILIINRMLGTLVGGGEITDLNAARHLAKRGHDVTIITGGAIFGRGDNAFKGLKVVYIKVPHLRKYAHSLERFNSKIAAVFYYLDAHIFEWLVLRWLSKKNKSAFDVVQMCSLFKLPEWILYKFGYPCVSWLPGPPSGLAQHRIKHLVHHSKFRMFTRGAPEFKLLKLGLKKGREYDIIEPGLEFDVINNAAKLDFKLERARLGLCEADLLGVTTARLVPIKNHALLLDAISLAKKQGTIWNWVFIGNGPLETELRFRALHLCIGEQIHWLGYQQSDAVYRTLSICDLFAITSSYENFSNAVLEAMAHRLPIIGTDVGYLRTLISEANAGLVVSSSDSEQLASILVEMADPKTRAGYGEAGRQFVEQFDWPNIAIKLENLYKKTIGNNNVLHTR